MGDRAEERKKIYGGAAMTRCGRSWRLQPGRRPFQTMSAGPISRLADAIMETKEELEPHGDEAPFWAMSAKAMSICL